MNHQCHDLIIIRGGNRPLALPLEPGKQYGYRYEEFLHVYYSSQYIQVYLRVRTRLERAIRISLHRLARGPWVHVESGVSWYSTWTLRTATHLATGPRHLASAARSWN